MNHFSRSTFQGILAVSALALAPAPALAGEYHNAVSLTYSSGFNDVVDWHEDNLPIVQEQSPIPIGATFRGIWTMDSGLRLDAGIGPLALILGDISYTDVPLQITLGYTFARGSGFSPYIRAGMSYHNVSGDYVVDSSSGSIGAVGVEFGGSDKASFFFELAVDSSEATFSPSGLPGPSAEVIEIGGTRLTIGVMF